MCEGTIDVEVYIEILERHMPVLKWCLFMEGHSTMPDLILPMLQQCGFIDTVCCLPAVQTCLLLKKYGTS